jgi:hypothetical protein
MFWKGEMPFFLISKYVGSSIHGKRGASFGIFGAREGGFWRKNEFRAEFEAL